MLEQVGKRILVFPLDHVNVNLKSFNHYNESVFMISHLRIITEHLAENGDIAVIFTSRSSLPLQLTSPWVPL